MAEESQPNPDGLPSNPNGATDTSNQNPVTPENSQSNNTGGDQIHANGPNAVYSEGDTYSDSIRQALRKAKKANGIPESTQPDITIKPNTPEGDQMLLDKRNIKLYEYTNNSGQKIHIRQDKDASYGQDGIGDQKSHFNAGPKGQKLKQHHYYEQ